MIVTSVVDFSLSCESADVLFELLGLGLIVSFDAIDVVVFSFSTTNVVVVAVVVAVVAAKAVQLNTVGRLNND